jgi:hypothetical protein
VCKYFCKVIEKVIILTVEISDQSNLKGVFHCKFRSGHSALFRRYVVSLG